MALDHTREYFHADAFMFDPLDLQKTSVILFFTRWITHFCAPIFRVACRCYPPVFQVSGKPKKQLAGFLVKRGMWLIFLELTVVNFSWFFNIHFSFILLAVIWALGFCMIFLAGLIFLPKKILLPLGILLIVAHNLLDRIHFPGNNVAGFIWSFFHDQNMYTVGHFKILLAYPILPYIGVMALGYCLGEAYTTGVDAYKRKQILLSIGTFSASCFSSFSGVVIIMEIRSDWTKQPTFAFSFLIFYQCYQIPTLPGLSPDHGRICTDFPGTDGNHLEPADEIYFRLWKGSDVLLYPAYLPDPSDCTGCHHIYRTALDANDRFRQLDRLYIRHERIWV